MTLRPRPYRVLVSLASWLRRRERAAWNAATRATDADQSRRWRNLSDRLDRFIRLCWECPRKGAA